jgi:hypothetical protein
MMLDLAVALAIGLVIGFILGYGVRVACFLSTPPTGETAIVPFLTSRFMHCSEAPMRSVE